MQPRTFTLPCTSLFLGLCLILVSGTAIAQEVSPGCEAAIDKAAGKYSQCLLKASAEFAKKGNEDRLFVQQMRCEDKWSAQVDQAQHRFGEDQCTLYLSAIEDRTATSAKGIATEASGYPAPAWLLVQNADGGTLTESTLTLTGVSAKTDFFSQHPYRAAGQVSTEYFISQWEEGPYVDDPPNVGFSCEVAGEPVTYFLELTAPSLDGRDLSYAAEAIGDAVLPTSMQCDSDSVVFIDSYGPEQCDEKINNSEGNRGFLCICQNPNGGGGDDSLCASGNCGCVAFAGGWNVPWCTGNWLCGE